MHRVLFSWRGRQVYSYSAMLYLGMVAGVIGGCFGAARHGLDPVRIYAAILVLLLPATVGSRLLFAGLHWKDFRDQPLRALRRTQGGGAMYGGLALALVLSVPLLRALAIPFGAFWDVAMVTILIGMIFTRVGCFMNGCCAGRPSDGPFTLNLPDVHGVWQRRIPAQVLEGGLAVALLTASLLAWGRLPFDGALFLANVAAYGVGRWWIELARETSGNPADLRLRQNTAIAMVVASAGAYLGIGLLTPGSQAVNQTLSAAPALGAQYYLLAPLAVLAVMSLFHSVGCSSFGASADMAHQDGPTGPDYPKTILGETNTATSNPAASILVAYWRLQEQPAPPPTIAKDEKGLNPGAYKTVTLPTLPNAKLDADKSPTTAQPTGLRLHGAPGLLGFEPPVGGNTSLEVNGGFVEVGASNSLNLPHFTIEALVRPTWDFTKKGLFYCLMEHSSPDGDKKRGVAIYAGPETPGQPNSPYRWQVWLGVKTGPTTKWTHIKPVTAPLPAPALVEPNKINYIAVTFDGSNIKLYSTYEGKVSAMDLGTMTQDKFLALNEPLAPGVFAPNTGPVPFFIGMGRDTVQPFAAAAPVPPERYPFNGRIQEVAVYSEALTWERIVSHFSAAFKDI